MYTWAPLLCFWGFENRLNKFKLVNSSFITRTEATKKIESSTHLWNFGGGISVHARNFRDYMFTNALFQNIQTPFLSDVVFPEPVLTINNTWT